MDWSTTVMVAPLVFFFVIVKNVPCEQRSITVVFW